MDRELIRTFNETFCYILCFQISGKILVMSNAVKEGMPFEECNLQSPCLCAEHLDIIQPIVYKINEELPISRCQFHQHFTAHFYVQKYFSKLFPTYSLTL